MNTRLSTLSMALALAFVAPSALALGLGQMQVKSGLNQPLVAEIPIVSATKDELNELDVSLASPEAFAAVGLERPLDLSANLQFSVGKNAGGQPVIRVTTPGRFNDPLLSFLIEAKWGTGSVTREYTALIDPPFIAPAVVRPMSAPAMAAEPPSAAPMASAPETAPAPAVTAETAPASEPEHVVTNPMPEPEPQVVQQAPGPTPEQVLPAPRPVPPALRSLRSKPAPAPAPSAAEAPAASGNYGPVAAGKTLWSIASQVRPDAGVSVNQVMLALLRSNADAFTGNNINQLKRGAVLRIPSRDEIATLSPDDAAALVREQAAAWQSPRTSVPQPAEGVATSPQAPPRPVASTPSRPAARLEIVPPSGKTSAKGMQSGAAAGGGGSELRAELVQTNEELAARTAEVTELKSRVSDLEKQQADRQHLIDLQNSQLKDLQTRLQQQDAVPAVAAAPAPAPATHATAAAEGDTQETPFYLNPYVLGGGGLILIGGLVFAMRRKPASSKAEDTTSRRISDDEALRASLAKTRAAVIKPPAPAVSIVPVPALATSGDAELDALTQAVQKNPKDLEAHLSLLRLYHGRGDAVDYEIAAQAMRAQVPSTLDPRWREAVIMGAALMPGHPLFNQAGWNAPRFDTVEPARPAAVLEKMPEPMFEMPATPEPSAPSVFDLPEEEQAMPAAIEEAHMDSLHVDSMHEFGDGGLDLIDSPGHLADAIPGHSDSGQSAPDAVQDDDASATRIELAKAYLDIGDLDGARSMLEEVLAEGGPAAQAEAERILREIG